MTTTFPAKMTLVHVLAHYLVYAQSPALVVLMRPRYSPPPPARIPLAHRDTKGWRLSLYLVLIVLVVVLVLESKSL